MEIQLTIVINVMSSKDAGETRAMHSKSSNYNIAIMTGIEIGEIIEERFKSLLQISKVV